MPKLIINADLGRQRISRHVYGHFAEHLGRCVYEGLWVGEDSAIPNTRGIRNDVLDALRKLDIPNLRWPGGCFADTYNWKDGIGPRENRPSIVNVHWGGCVENNHCGTHEFLDLCDLLSAGKPPERRCEPYICGNVGSGTVREMAEWLEYLTMPAESPMANLRRRNGRQDPWSVKYWAVGNENWGCGGHMRPQYYADLYRQYQGYCRTFNGQRLYKIACGHEDAWNEVLMREAASMMNGLSIHYYTVPGPWKQKGSAIDFTTDEWHTTLRKALAVEEFIDRTSAIMDRYDPQRRVGIILDEWGTWFDVEPGTNPGFLYQQNTIRDALVAGASLNVFHAKGHRLHMANIAQTVNVLQAMILTDGPRMLRTPTYHVFEMYKVHQDATHLPTEFADNAGYATSAEQPSIPQVSASASRDAAGKVHVSLCNLHHADPAEVHCEFRGGAARAVTGRVLTAPAQNTMNTFDHPDVVHPAPFEDLKMTPTGWVATLPPRSVAVLEVA